MSQQRKVIAIVKGGLGNQLFCYAAARRLAIVNSSELVLDDVSGFVDDIQYNRQFVLDQFPIRARKATNRERLEPLGKQRRRILRWFSRRQKFNSRVYIEQHGRDFDSRLVDLRFDGTRYLEGYWQSPNYFQDIELEIRSELEVPAPADELNHKLASEIRSGNSVGVHVRRFDSATESDVSMLSRDYYERALNLLEDKLDAPKYFVFSDDPEKAMEVLPLPQNRTVTVSHNRGDEAAICDLWLMSQCEHFITANSTFSWWGAWLGSGNSRIITTPALVADGIGTWGFKGLIPDDWTRI